MAKRKISDAALRELLDRQEILDCIHRYTRGIDRHDKEMVLSAYHPDAIDDHGLYCGVAKDFVDWACWFHDQNQTLHHHYVTNHSVEIDGDTAHAETYWLFVGVNKDGAHPLTLTGGRYIDRFERREDKWGIAARTCLIEWQGDLAKLDAAPEFKAAALAGGISAWNKSDASYDRPFNVKRQPMPPIRPAGS
jgi:ketosteroid isomerase-like protein